MKKKIVSLLVVLSLLVMAMAACSKNDSSKTSTPSPGNTEQKNNETEGKKEGEKDEKVKIGYYGIDTTQAFFKDVYDGLVKACEERGWELYAQFTNYDPVKMRSAYDQFKSIGVDIIIDGNAMQDIITPFAQEAANDNIPYLGLHVYLPEPAYTYGTDNSDMGKAVGEFIGKQVKEEWGGKVDLIILVGTFTTGPEITERLTSAVPALGNYVDDIDNVKVVKVDTDVGDTQNIYQQVSDTLSANPNKKIVMFCQTDDMANTAFSAVEAAGRSNDVMGTGSDCSAIALDYFKAAVDSGNMTAPWRGSIYLDAINYGYALCDITEKILAGEDVEHQITFMPGVAGLNNLYEVFPDLKD